MSCYGAERPHLALGSQTPYEAYAGPTIIDVAA